MKEDNLEDVEERLYQIRSLARKYSVNSTFLHQLEMDYKDNPNVIFLKEPVDEWNTVKDTNGTTMLQKFYADQEKYSFAFQMMAFISRLSILKKAMKENKNIVIISERSLFTDKYVFAKMLHDQEKIEDVNYQIYLKWFDEFANEFPVDHMIYVKTSPEICHFRILKRSRKGEEVIPLSYLDDCHQYHEEFINKHMNCPTTLLNGNQDIFEEHHILELWIEQIQSIIQGNYK
jgi:deoxyadenosine/deoxycytidine kinase